MVGSHTIIGKNADIKIESLNFLKHEPWFSIEQIESSENITMFLSSYHGYPYMVFKDADWTVILEGLIYNLSDEEIKNRCGEIADYFVKNKDYFEAIRQFITISDGEFFIQVYDKQSNKYIGFNDHLGRLPIYYSNDSETFIISRDIKTNLEFGSKIEFDLTGITEFLILGYSLGNKTYFKNINKLEPFQALLI
jgi:asparagine synthetase B (glutamine-hydrolysing)